MPHHFYNENPVVRGCRRMNAVNRVCRDVHRTVKAKGHIRSVDVVINRFRKMNDVQAFFTEKICCLLGSVSAENHQAVEAELVIVLLHGFHLVEAILIRLSHQFERLTGCTENCTAAGKNTGKIVIRQHPVIAVDEALVSIHKTIDFQLIQIIRQALNYAPHSSIQSLTVASACQHTNSHHTFVLS